MYSKEGNIYNVFSGNINSTGDTFVKYFNVAKNCGTATDQDCVSEYNENHDGNSEANRDWNTSSSYYKFVTTDGMTYSLNSWNNNCTGDRGVDSHTNSPTLKTCGFFYVDVNGKKAPNNLGRDVFLFYK